MIQSGDSLEKARQAFNTAVVTYDQQVPSTVGQPWDASLVKYLTTSVLIFGLLVLGMMTFLFARSKDYKSILPSFAVPLIVVSAVTLVLVGFGSDQIAPVIGLLGTVAGYLLGKEGNRLPEHEPNRGITQVTSEVEPSEQHKPTDEANS